MVLTNLPVDYRIGSASFTAEQLVNLLDQYRLMPALWREIIIDQALIEIQLTSEEEQAVLQKLSENQKNSKVIDFNLSLIESQSWNLRKARIEKFKQQEWGNKIDDYFLSRKQQLDRAVYYLLRHREHLIIQELFFRLQERETTFAELVPQYSNGPEVHTRGLIGPVEMGKLNPVLASQLCNSQPGQILAPIHLGDWWVIIELVEWLPAQLDDNLRQQLLTECFEKWMSEKLKAELRIHQNST